MPKPKTRPAISSTKYGEITPTWVPEGQKFPAQYNEATEALADWVGPDWADESKSSFAKIRRTAVELCERWNAWDWDADEIDLESKKQDLKNYNQIGPALEIIERCLMQSHNDRLSIIFHKV